MELWLSRITDYLLAQSWQIAVLTVVVAIVSFLLRNRSAHVRYLLWLLVLAKCLVPPLHSVPFAVLPQEQPIAFVESPPIAERTFDASRVERYVVTEPAKSTSAQAPMEPPPKTIEGPTTYNIRVWLAMGWLVGAVALLFYNLLNALRTQIWLRRQRKALPVKFRHNVENFFSTHGMKHIPKVWLINGMNQPFVWGLVRGSIYLPADLLNFQDSKSWASLLGHELSHVIRFDAMVHTFQIFAQVIFWFHPFVWWANRKIRAEREKCCDEMAIVSLHALPEDYSEAIVEVLAVKYESIRPVPSLAVAGPVKNIEERIKTMLRPGKTFYKRPSLIAATVVLLIAFLTVPTALVLTARAAEDATENEAESVKLLHQAVAEGDIEQVKLLLSKGANVNEKNKKGRTPLHTASRHGRKDVAEVLISKGANVDARDASGRSPLHLAVHRGLEGCVSLLIAKAANIHARDNVGNTPLHHAVRYKSIGEDMLEFLLKKGAEVDAQNDYGHTSLHLAAVTQKPYHGEHVAVNFLVANGANINAKGKKGNTPLHIAAGNGRRDSVELLLAKGAVIGEKTDEGLTVLHVAAVSGRTDVAELLIRRIGRGESALDTKDKRGCTPLHYASKAGSNDIVELLISNDVHVNAENARGATPAHLAIVQNHKATVKLLISKGVDISTIQLAAYIGDLTKVRNFIEKGVSVNAQDGYGLSPLHAAAGAGQREVAEFLITEGALVNAGVVEEGLGMPLHYAVDGGSKEVAELLISKGAVINARNKDGGTPLHLAAKRGHSELARLLIANKADVNAKTGNGSTPLYVAAENGHEDTVALLTENGADVNVVTEPRKWTPLFSAARSGHKGVMKVLLDKGADVSAVDGVDGLLYWVCVHGGTDLAEILIRKGANVNSEAEGWEMAPSLYAVWSKHADILRVLLNNGADPNAKDEWDWSLLHYTVDPVFRSLDMTRMLLEKGANPNAKLSADFSTPFSWAVYYDLKETVELFIAHGADINAIDSKGQTPLQYAKKKGYTEIVELLRKHGARE